MPAPAPSDLRPHPAPEAVAFALAQPAVTPGDDPGAAQVLELYLVMGEDVTGVHLVSPGESVRAGTSALAVIPAPPEVLPHDDVTVFEAVPGEAGPTWALRYSPTWGGHLVRRGRTLPLAELRAEGLATPEPDGQLRVLLERDDQALVEIGRVSVVARRVRPARKVPRPAMGTVEPAPAGIFSFVVVALALLAVALGTVPPAPAATRMIDEDRLTTLFLRPPPPPPPAPTVSPKHGETGSGERGTSSPTRSRSRGGGDSRGLLSAFDDPSLGDALGGKGLPSGILAGIQGLVGSRATGGPGGSAPGRDGLGGGQVAGMGDWPGGGHGGPGGSGDPDGWGGPRLRKQEGGDIGRAGEVISLGSIRPEDVDRVVKRHLAAIRYCYQRELQRTPSLAGKLSVKFTIAGDGSVSSSTTQSSTLGSPATEACVNNQFLKMAFPPLRGGGVAIVKYPFYFAPG